MPFSLKKHFSFSGQNGTKIRLFFYNGELAHSSVSDLDPVVSNIFFYLCKYILDYEPCNSVSKLSQKPRVVLKFKWEHFKLIVVRKKFMYLHI
jgi:hypothetical protein